MNILLLLPYDNTYFYKGFFTKSISYAPLTLTTLAALVPNELEASIDIVDEGVQRGDYGKKQYDIVGITCVTSSSPRAYQLAAYFRMRGSFVVLGGAHPTLMPEEALQHADSVVAGPGEIAWPRLLADFVQNKTKPLYSEPCVPAGSIPVPARNLVKNNPYINIPTIIASRGCKNSCDFCSINKLIKPGFRRNIDDVIAEIKSMKSKNLLFLDPNITTDPEYAALLFEKMIGLNKKWAGLINIETVKNSRLLKLMVRSGCIAVLVGFESITQDNLTFSHKGTNKVGFYKEAVRILHSHQLAVLGTFVFGFDFDTKQSIYKTLEVIDEIKIDLPRFSILTPFPGTGLFDQLKKEKRIIHKNWYYYDQEHVTFLPKHMGPAELQHIVYDVWKKAYSLGNCFKRTGYPGPYGFLKLTTNLGMRRYAYKLKSRI